MRGNQSLCGGETHAAVPSVYAFGQNHGLGLHAGGRVLQACRHNGHITSGDQDIRLKPQMPPGIKNIFDNSYPRHHIPPIIGRIWFNVSQLSSRQTLYASCSTLT